MYHCLIFICTIQKKNQRMFTLVVILLTIVVIAVFICRRKKKKRSTTSMRRREEPVPGEEWNSRRSVTGDKTYYWKDHGPYVFRDFPKFRLHGRENRQLMPMNLWQFGQELWEQVLYRLEVKKKNARSPFMYVSYGSYTRTNLMVKAIEEPDEIEGARYWHLDSYVRRTHMTLQAPTYCVSSMTWEEFFEDAKERVREYLRGGDVEWLGKSEHLDN